MRPVPREERGYPAVMPPVFERRSTNESFRAQQGFETSESTLPETEEAEPYRPVRNGSLRDLLDDEFSRNYKFEGFSDFFSDLKGFLKKVVVGEEELDEFGEFLAGAVPQLPEPGERTEDREAS